MELYIRLINGQPFEHPIFGDNFRQAFPDVDTDNLPFEFARFTRHEPPIIGVYEVYEGVTYEQCADGYEDVHHVRAMSDEEKQSRQDESKADWAQHGFSSWVFDDATCSFKPPVAYPQDGKPYMWDEPTLSWIEVTNV